MKNEATPTIDSLVGRVMQITSVGLYPIVGAQVLEEAHVFDASRDISEFVVSIYPPDLVRVRRVLDGGRHLICRYAGGPLCVVPWKCLTFSEVKLS